MTEKEVKGATYNLNSFNGKLLAAVNSKIELFRLAVPFATLRARFPLPDSVPAAL